MFCLSAEQYSTYFPEVLNIFTVHCCHFHFLLFIKMIYRNTQLRLRHIR